MSSRKKTDYHRKEISERLYTRTETAALIFDAGFGPGVSLV